MDPEFLRLKTMRTVRGPQESRQPVPPQRTQSEGYVPVPGSDMQFPLVVRECSSRAMVRMNKEPKMPVFFPIDISIATSLNH